MAIDNLPTSNEGRLSGAYIRSLVKQLTSSKPLKTNKNLTNNNDIGVIVGGEPISPNKGDKTLGNNMAKQTQHQQAGHKKQVRRRLHTSRPYQERLLNMAEARKEIVTALKFHRAAMKANERKQPPPLPTSDQHLHPQYHNAQLILGVQGNGSSNNNNACPSQYSYPWLTSSSSPLNEPPTSYETLNIPLPHQPLGLNLNLQAFTNLDTTFTTTPSSNVMKHNYSSFPSSSSTPIAKVDYGSVGPNSGSSISDMHPALDEEEMAEIRSIGEQHQIEWDDTLNLVKSAWWLKFLKSVEIGNKEMKGDNSEYHHPFGEFMEFPAWLSANEGFLQQHLDDYCSEDTTLPWMDIGDIDGMDDEWLS